jgi:hypothetical protein
MSVPKTDGPRSITCVFESRVLVDAVEQLRLENGVIISDNT